MKTLIFLLFICSATLVAGSFNLFTDSMSIDTGKYRYIKFRITPDQAVNPQVIGTFSTEPEGLPVEFILLTEFNYRTGWENRGFIDTLSVSRTGSGDFVMPIPDFGDFVLVVSNRGNYQPVRIYADIQVAFAGTGITYDSLPMGMTVLILLLAAALVVAAVILTARKLG